METINGNKILGFALWVWLPLAVAITWESTGSQWLSPLVGLIGPMAIPLCLFLAFCVNRTWQYFNASNDADKQHAAEMVYKNAEAAATIGTLGTFLAMAQMDVNSNLMEQVSYAINSSLAGMGIHLIFTYLVDKPDPTPKPAPVEVNVEAPDLAGKEIIKMTTLLKQFLGRIEILTALAVKNEKARKQSQRQYDRDKTNPKAPTMTQEAGNVDA